MIIKIYEDRIRMKQREQVRYFFFILLLCTISEKVALAVTNNELFENKNILILGGTGYLGRAITVEVLKYNPKSITIFSRDEVKHFNCSKMFGSHQNVQSMIGDIRDYDSVFQATRGIDIVFHVAALKRMDALESNVQEAIKTNILGSVNVFQACIANGVDKVLFISTDKACSPINTYGACKFVSEKIFTNYDHSYIKTKFMVARFGNILESTGSVIPIFAEKIKNGEEIPLTDDRMTRFIVSKEQAVELIFNALKYGVGGEIFVKKLPALRIIDLIEVLKHKYNAHNTIKVIGLRPGEKIHEVLINESEMVRTYAFQDYYVITPSLPDWNKNEIALYIEQGIRFTVAGSCDYSSAQAVINQSELQETFMRLGLL